MQLAIYYARSIVVAKKLRVLLLCLCTFAVCTEANVLQVYISNADDLNSVEPSVYFERVLQLALEKTRKSDGDFVVLHNPKGIGPERVRAILVAGSGVDVMWSTANPERTRTMQFVPVDLLKGLNNYRVFLIHKDNQAVFNAVNTLGDLRKLSVGSGVHWSDTEILKFNNINPITTVDYHGLIKMLAAQRFDYIGRGLYEIQYELSLYAKMDLALENHLLLQYDTPLQYGFFVNKNNTVLANRIERGLKIAQADGSFDALFYSFPTFKAGMEMLNNADRVVIKLNSKIK